MKDFTHIKQEHNSDEDRKYINNGITMPLCSKSECKAQNKFISGDEWTEDSEDISLDCFRILHSYFAHRMRATDIDEKEQFATDFSKNVVSSHNSMSTNKEANNQEQKPEICGHTYGNDEERIQSILEQCSISTLKLLFYGLKKKFKYKDTQSICGLILDLLPHKIDLCHADIPFNALQAPNGPMKQHLQIFRGALIPNKAIAGVECQYPWKCPVMKRIIYIMKLYNKIKHQSVDSTDSDECECENEAAVTQKDIYFIMLCDEYSLNDLIDDFQHIKSQHLLKNIKSWYVIKNEEKGLGLCKYEETDCYLAKRHLRDRKYDKSVKERRRIYNNKHVSKDVVPYQFLDGIHYFLMHWDYRKHSFPQKMVQNDSEETEHKVSANCDQCNTHTKDISPDIDVQRRQNRFFTDLVSDNNYDLNIISPQSSFEYGTLFYPWKFYNKKDTYVPPDAYRYQNLKTEMLHNKYAALDINEWSDTLTKTIILKSSAKGKTLHSTDRGDYNFNKSIPKDLPISISHLMVILIYTDYDEPQCEFKKHGMRTDNLSNQCEIANFYQLFFETILFYGQKTKETDIFYHGISKLYFTQFHPKFNVPISTTKNEESAKQFCGDSGMILALKADQSIKDTYFDCGWCSRHIQEEELLFSHAHYLFIQDIKLVTHDLNVNASYSKYLLALALFQDILNGVYFTYSMPDYQNYECIIVELLKTMASADNNSTHDVPPYIQHSFNHLYKYCRANKPQILSSEYMQLQDETKAELEKHFEFGNDVFVHEFWWKVPNDLNMTKNKVITSHDRAYQNNFTFCMYLKPNSHALSEKVTVGVWVKTIWSVSSIKKEVNIEWGFKCKETHFSLSKLEETLEPDTSDAYKAFLSSELKGGNWKELNFIFYVKLH